ncbi:hypothetical protein [Olleya sp. YS]|uniref:hypothetical protein n=1 Tax=Olleya sp. YS TaxID=3028318 RepID=UPI002434264F|nr:hypothetical protein [Olleya sp. YS]WGD34541.1 hypothetical protein Ollyesu_12220 [Olleya sp. YS]
MENLSTVFANPAAKSTGVATDGVSVNAYGQGQCSGVTYTVPAHGDIKVGFTLKMQCVTPKNVDALDALIRGMLSASNQKKYDQLTEKSSSGGRGFFLWFSAGGSRTSYKQTTHIMESYGLTREQQTKIIDAMVKMANEVNTFTYKGTINNDKYDYSVSGSLFGIVMDATIQKGENHAQLRFLAPNVHLDGNDGASSLPSVGKLY